MTMKSWLCSTVLMAKHPRDSWKLEHFALEVHLTHTLADAPFTSTEREQIYRVLDQNVNSFSDAERDETRKSIMSFFVGSIGLASDGSQQILMRGNGGFCGATGNCSLWILVRKGGQLRLALRTLGQFLIVQKTLARGFHDIAIGQHESAFDERYKEYRWRGSAYRESDCYLAEKRRTEEPPLDLTFIEACR